MKTLFSILAITMGLSSLAHAITNCSDASGTNRYELDNYQGGAAPRPGMQVDDIKIFVNNVLMSEQKYYAGNSKPVPLNPSLLVTFDSSVEYDMPSDNSNPVSVSKTYATLMTISGNPLAPGPSIKPISVYVICHHVDYMYP